MSADPVMIKGEMSLLNVVQLADTNMAEVRQSLAEKRDSLPGLFASSPVIVDCGKLGEDCAEIDFLSIRKMLVELGFIPVGIRNFPEILTGQAVQAGWAILRNSRPETTTRIEKPVDEHDQQLESSGRQGVTVIERPVRSGQQVYFPDGDVVVLQNTSAGSEVLAGGSVHVYGSLRGRVLAGIQGDASARIFCQKLEAELVAIAGNYRLLDDIETNLKGRPAMVWLEGEKLRISPMP